MDHSLLSYHSNLAQMPTDQREHEQHLSVQTASSDAESFLLVNASQPYSPCPPGENWSAFRSNPAPGSMLPFRQPGYTSDAWGATVSNPYELDSDQILWDLVPETIHHSSFYLTPQPTASSRIAPPYSMNTHLIPSASKREDTDYLWDKAASVASLFLPHGNPRQRPTPINTAEANALAIRTSPLSPSTSISSQQSPAHSLDSMSPTTSAATDATSPQTSFGDNSDPDSGAESPYSKLIWDALKSAPGNKMQLQEIYAWFEKNTSRGKDRNKGWQNSIRHNLSMNAGFVAVKDRSGKKTPSYWCLTKEAARHGVQSTTRYRKANHRKMMGSDPPILGRQRSRSKGGRAAKHAAKMRHTNYEEHHKERSVREPTLHRSQQPSPKSPLHATSPVRSMPHYQQVPHNLHALPGPNGLPPVTKDPSIHSFDSSTVIGCTSPPPGDNAMICDAAEPTPNYTAFDMGQFSWYGL